jgi:hypothetical protein
VRIRYAYVSELDLMARLAALRLRERWADWDRQPYPSRSWTHVSVWEHADGSKVHLQRETTRAPAPKTDS